MTCRAGSVIVRRPVNGRRLRLVPSLYVTAAWLVSRSRIRYRPRASSDITIYFNALKAPAAGAPPPRRTQRGARGGKRAELAFRYRSGTWNHFTAVAPAAAATPSCWPVPPLW